MGVQGRRKADPMSIPIVVGVAVVALFVGGWIARNETLAHIRERNETWNNLGVMKIESIHNSRSTYTLFCRHEGSGFLVRAVVRCRTGDFIPEVGQPGRLVEMWHGTEFVRELECLSTPDTAD